jgi:hypothetical protein
MIKLLSVAHHKGPVWINPAHVAFIRPGVPQGSDLHCADGTWICSVEESPELIADKIRMMVQ